MAKSPVIAIDVRCRSRMGGPGDDEGEWIEQRFAPGDQVRIRGLTRDVPYEFQSRHVGVGGLASDWVPMGTHTVAGTNRRGAAALPPVTVGNVASRWVSGTAVTFTATDTSATITVTAGTLQIGGRQISYGASSATIAGAANEVRTVYLYYDDPQLVGGTRTLGVTTDAVASMASHSRIFIAALKVTFAPTGGTSDGGGDIGGGGGGSGTNTMLQ
jgi:hypothetical protein